MRRSILAVIAIAVCCLAETAAGIKWTMPREWKPEAPRPMRAATYRVPAAAPDKEDGECGVFFFGPGQGGGVQSNLERWTAQFEQQPAPAKTQKQTINSLNVTTVDVSGTYTGGGGPMSAAKSSKPNYRLLGAIVQAPEGLVFFKFTGPAKTVAANQTAFQSLLHSVTK